MLLLIAKAMPLVCAAEYLSSSDDSCWSLVHLSPSMTDFEVSSSSESMLSISERELALILLINVFDILYYALLGTCDSLKFIPPPMLLLLGMKFLFTNLALLNLHYFTLIFFEPPSLLFSFKFCSSDLLWVKVDLLWVSVDFLYSIPDVVDYATPLGSRMLASVLWRLSLGGWFWLWLVWLDWLGGEVTYVIAEVRACEIPGWRIMFDLMVLFTPPMSDFVCSTESGLGEALLSFSLSTLIESNSRSTVFLWNCAMLVLPSFLSFLIFFLLLDS